MAWRDIVEELTRERGSLTGNHADECGRLYTRGWVILISGVLFCCSFVTIGVPVVSIGALLIHMATRQACQPMALAMHDTAIAVIQQDHSTSIYINCPRCGSSDLIPLSKYVDRFSETATANPPERIQRVYKCKCGHGFSNLQIVPVQQAACATNDRAKSDEFYWLQIGSVSLRVEVPGADKTAAPRSEPMQLACDQVDYDHLPEPTPLLRPAAFRFHVGFKTFNIMTGACTVLRLPWNATGSEVDWLYCLGIPAGETTGAPPDKLLIPVHYITKCEASDSSRVPTGRISPATKVFPPDNVVPANRLAVRTIETIIAELKEVT